jgi:hypothetical protein
MWTSLLWNTLSVGKSLDHSASSISGTQTPDRCWLNTSSIFICMWGGKPGLQAKFPSFAKLFDHIMLYIKAVYTSKLSQTQKCPKSTSDHDGTSVDGLCQLHVNIFGPPFTSDHTFDLPLIEPHLIGADEVQQYTFGQQCFVWVISDVFIYPGLISINAQLNGPGCKAQSSKLNILHQGCIKCLIICGALIDSIVEARNGNDGVLLSSAIESILRSPAFLFDMSLSYHTNNDVVVRKLLKDPVLTLAPIWTWVENFVASSTNTSCNDLPIPEIPWAFNQPGESQWSPYPPAPPALYHSPLTLLPNCLPSISPSFCT